MATKTYLMLDFTNARWRADGILGNHLFVQFEISSIFGRCGYTNPISPSIHARIGCSFFIRTRSCNDSARPDTHHWFWPVANHCVWIEHRRRLASLFKINDTSDAVDAMIKQIAIRWVWAVWSSWITTIWNTAWILGFFFWVNWSWYNFWGGCGWMIPFSFMICWVLKIPFQSSALFNQHLRLICRFWF